MPKGIIVNLLNNYGYISTDDYKHDNELIPFRVSNEMLEEIDGKVYIKYTVDVEFTLKNQQGVRDRDIREAINIRFIGNEWKYQDRTIEKNNFKIIKNRLFEYNFYYPEIEDTEFADWLKCNNFQPRLLEYLVPGVFIPKKIILYKLKERGLDFIDIEKQENKFNIRLLFLLDRIDIEFRKNILSWVTGIENAYKTYFNMLSIFEESNNLADDVIQKWANNKPNVSKIIKRARNKRLFRVSSEEFDYVSNEMSVPLFDFMEQLELIELTELISYFYNICSSNKHMHKVLEKMKECVSFIRDLCALRNASAHGRSIIPLFMDPDYNGNWDLEFDNIDNRSNVESWILYDLLKNKWEKIGFNEYSKHILNTLYGNPVRRAWIELNYLYFYIVKEIEEESFNIFYHEARMFLEPGNDSVDILNLTLSNIGDTTPSFFASPYEEIASEAFSVWEIFNVNGK